MELKNVLAQLEKRCKGRSQIAVAEDLGITAAYLGAVLLGKRLPGPKVLRAMGLKKVVSYVEDRG